MAGNKDDLPTNPAGSPEPRVKTFSCKGCGASVTVRYAGASLTVVCDSCSSVIDLTDENYRIISRYYEKSKKPIIPLGSKGTLFDRKWEVIGFMERKDVPSGFTWQEYLLFNPYHGYRWLTHSRGHWSFVTPIKEKPAVGQPVFIDFGSKFRLFYYGRAVVTYVHGEFYWKVRVGEEVRMADFIAPPEMLSSEENDSEVNWAFSEYLDAKELFDAFKLKYRAPEPGAVVPNQPSPFTTQHRQSAIAWVFFFILMSLFQIVYVASCKNTDLLNQTFVATPNMKFSDLTSKSFLLEKNQSAVKIAFDCPAVDNSWAYISGELVNDQTGEVYPFERDIEYYHGYTDGENWSEGGKSSDLVISKVPAGVYYLNIDGETGQINSSSPIYITARVNGDVPLYANYLWAILAISVFPLYIWWQRHTFEVRRWSESDYSPYISTSSDD